MFEKLIERKDLKKKMERKEVINDDMKIDIEERIRKIEDAIEKEVSEDQMKEAMETLRELGSREDSINGEGRKKMWKMLKNIYPKITPTVPVGKKDKSGNIITNHKGLKKNCI